MTELESLVCPKCERRWAVLSEQACCVEAVGHCIVCEMQKPDSAVQVDGVTLMSWLDENGIIAKRKELERRAGYTVEPCPQCLVWRDKSQCPRCGGLGSIKVDEQT